MKFQHGAGIYGVSNLIKKDFQKKAAMKGGLKAKTVLQRKYT